MPRHSVFAMALVASAMPFGSADILAGKPDPAPAGHEAWISPLIVPSPPVTGHNGWQEAVAKAKDFVHDLTLAEKVNLTTGFGLHGACIGSTGTIPRKGFQGFCLDDGAAGVRRAQHNSVFPSNLNLAATWDKTLMLKQGKGLGSEMRAKGVNVALAPDMNMVRSPAAGRNFEMPGADPYLSGVTAVGLINGIQSQGVIATAKHFVAYEQEHARGGSLSQAYSSNVDDRTLHEIYLWPFAESVHVGVGAVMTSYNRVNQTFAAENSYLINGLLKEQLDFQGVVMSDWAAQSRGIDTALAGQDWNMPGFKAYGAGDASAPYDPVTGYPGDLDPSKGRGGFWGANLIDAVKNGTLPEERLTDMAVRIMAPYFKLGQANGFPSTDLNRATVATYIGETHADPAAYHAQLIRETGAASAVLVKNADGTLPLKIKGLKTIGVFGNDAGPNPDGPNSCNDGACYTGTTAGGWGSATAQFPYLIDPLQAINAYASSKGGNVKVEAVLDDSALSEAAAVAARSDVCIVCVGANSGEGYLTVEGNAGDRNDLEIWHAGAKMVQTVAAACKKTIVVIHSPGTVNIESFADNDNVKAVLAAGQPGQESGNALVDVLFGSVNPSGRLPYTWGKDRKDYGADVHYYNTTGLNVSSPISTIPQLDYSEKLLLDHRWFEAKTIKPRYAFGFGLSYTTFEYSKISVEKTGKGQGAAPLLSLDVDLDLDISLKARSEDHQKRSSLLARASATKNTTEIVHSIPPRRLAALSTSIYEDAINVHFKVRNSGKVAGHEVAQLYLSFPADAGEPPKILRGFERVYLEAGKSTTITLTLRKKDISVWDTPSQSWVIPKGRFRVQVGAASDDIRLDESFRL